MLLIFVDDNNSANIRCFKFHQIQNKLGVCKLKITVNKTILNVCKQVINEIAFYVNRQPIVIIEFL